jgi:hypothetical protein
VVHHDRWDIFPCFALPITPLIPPGPLTPRRPGILLAYCFGIGTRNINGAGAWEALIGIGFVFAAILGIGIQFMPESPVRPFCC